MKSRTQGSRPRPRTQKKSEAKAKAKDSLSKDRHSRGQGPRTQAQVLSKKKKKVFTKIFQALHKILTIQKILLSSCRGQANFRGLEASRPRPRTSKCDLEDVFEVKDVLKDSTSAFCHIFVIGKISIVEGVGPLPPPLDYAYAPSEENKKGVCKFSAKFLAFSNEISTVQKIVLSSSRGQGNFRVLEASRSRT